MDYSWSRSANIGVPASDAAVELDRIAGLSGGDLTAEQFVEQSRTPGSLFHGLFEWDDEAAAEKYRKAEASRIARSLCINTKGE